MTKMEKFSYLSNSNAAFVEDLYEKYKKNEADVDSQWIRFFEGFEYAQETVTPVSSAKPSSKIGQYSDKEVAVTKLISSYRARGHLLADTNPVRERRQHKADLVLDYFGLNEADLDQTFEAGNEISLGKATLRDILAHLTKTYCGSIGVEFMYCRDEKLRQWLYSEMEPIGNEPVFSREEKLHILEKIDHAVSFESFLQMKFVGKKRFSLEGNEAIIPSLDAAIRQGAKMGAQEFVLGMAHRGRLNVLVNIFGKQYETVFYEFEGSTLPDDLRGGGDVKYHLGRSADITTADGHEVHLSLVPNPSHLEAVNPVVQGIVYAKRNSAYGGDSQKIIPILIHGDSAISGQGVNYELINMSKLEGYAVGGTVHIVLNNQVGFTANYKECRSSVYCTALAILPRNPDGGVFN